MSLTYVFIILMFVSIAACFGGIVSCMDIRVKEGHVRYAATWACIPLIILFAGLAIGSADSNHNAEVHDWKNSCTANGGEVVAVSDTFVCLEPGVKFVGSNISKYS